MYKSQKIKDPINIKKKLNSCKKRSSPQKPETLDLVIRAAKILQRHKNKQQKKIL